MQSMMADLGVTTQVRVWPDSNAAKAIASRRGLGKTRHVELRYLWLQDVTKSGRAKMRRIPGEQNLADHLTKGKAGHQIETLIRGVGGIMKTSGDSKGGDERKKWRGLDRVRELSPMRWYAWLCGCSEADSSERSAW